MSQTLVLTRFIPYVRTVLEDMGYTEHDDEFDQDNIAGTVIHKTFMITPGSLSSSVSSHTSFEWTFPVKVSLFFEGYRKPSDAIDGAIEGVELFLDQVLDVEKRFSIEGIQTLRPTSIDFNPIDGSNDTIIQASIGLTATIQMFNDLDC